jgi:hypothetical protein
MSVVAPHMTPNLANMNDNTSATANEGDLKSSPNSAGGNVVRPADSSEDLHQQGSKGSSPEKRNNEEPLSPTPQLASANYSHGQHHQVSNLTPQQPRAGAYMVSGYHHHHQQMTPEPPSPGGPVVLQNDAYNVGSFFQQQAGAFVPHTSPFGATQPSPLSPPRPAAAVVMGAMGVIPPASPLFPRLSSGGSNVGGALNPADSGLSSSRGGVAPPSPSLHYSMQPLGATMYQTYGSNQVVSSQSINSPDDGSGGVAGSWSDRYVLFDFLI